MKHKIARRGFTQNSHPVLDTGSHRFYSGFTLVELLVVVLIIGVLAAIALPMYQKAVMKSRFAALMPIAKAMAESNEAYYLEHNAYISDPQDLPVQGQMEYPDGTEIEFGTTSEYSYVLATRGNNFPNNYIVYQKHSANFPANIHCEADENNTQAQEVCTSFGGQFIPGSLTDGYKTYVLSGTRTEQDKLPTSISKIKAQICAGFAEENCVVDDDNETITTYMCGTVGDSSGALYSWLNNSGDGANGCMGTQYDLDGNPVGTRKIKCTRGTTFKADKTACVGTPTSTDGLYEIIREGNMEYSKSCSKKQNNECTQYSLDNYTYYDGSNTQQHKIGFLCESSQINADRTCSSYIALRGNAAMSEFTQNPQGKETWSIACTHRNSDGICTSMREGYIRTYAADGKTQTGSISASCTISHPYDTNPCTEYRLSYSGEATGPTTCAAANFNFNTFECSQS